MGGVNNYPGQHPQQFPLLNSGGKNNLQQRSQNNSRKSHMQ